MNQHTCTRTQLKIEPASSKHYTIETQSTANTEGQASNTSGGKHKQARSTSSGKQDKPATPATANPSRPATPAAASQAKWRGESPQKKLNMPSTLKHRPNRTWPKFTPQKPITYTGGMKHGLKQ
jgi:hypothetical protein